MRSVLADTRRGRRLGEGDARRVMPVASALARRLRLRCRSLRAADYAAVDAAREFP